MNVVVSDSDASPLMQVVRVAVYVVVCVAVCVVVCVAVRVVVGVVVAHVNESCHTCK